MIWLPSRATCTPDTYAEDPEEHQWCCRPHTVTEAEWADTLAERRSRGELNPEIWPPLVDEERFDIRTHEVETLIAPTPAPDDLTIDDLD